jgi:hypothetical protein
MEAYKGNGFRVVAQVPVRFIFRVYKTLYPKIRINFKFQTQSYDGCGSLFRYVVVEVHWSP